MYNMSTLPLHAVAIQPRMHVYLTHVRTSLSKPIAGGRGRLVELFCILASIYPPSFTLLHMQDSDVSAERKRVTSGATAEDEVIVIKNLAKVVCTCTSYAEAPG